MLDKESGFWFWVFPRSDVSFASCSRLGLVSEPATGGLIKGHRLPDLECTAPGILG